MTIVSSVASHIPYLRRFARALTGTQASGDAYVAATLEAVMEGTGAGDPLPTRLSLFRAFLRIWGSIPVNKDGTADPENRLMQTAHSRLEAITPLPRVAFLLNALEGFNTEEIAEVMGRPATDIQALLGMASSEIAAHLSTDVLIIEDEPIIALDLENLVTELGHKVVAIAATKDDAVAKAKSERPGLVLADINLGEGGSGIDAVSEILASFDIPVIFITAYPEKLLTGERPEPTYLIAKPFLPETVQATVGQALFFHPVAKEAA